MAFDSYLAYIAACLAITVVPGPTVTLIIANSLSHGTRAGLLNIVGTEIGIAFFITVLAVGLAGVLAGLASWFDWLRIAGALYLLWLGIRLILRPQMLTRGEVRQPPRGGFVFQGLLVILSNPKALLVFGAFIPQFVDPARATVPQVLLLGGTFMAVGMTTDSIWAIAVGRAGHALSRSRVRLISCVSGMFLVGGGVWLALSRR
jgi:homoserine/homoserine lactone efflux protein